MTTTTASGTFAMKMSCHEKKCVRTPPTFGPMIAARPQTAPRRPSAEPRRSTGDAIRDRGGRDGEDAARTRRLNDARDEKDRERRRHDREHAPGRKDRDAERVDRATADRIGELRHDRDADDVRKQIEREGPRDVAAARCRSRGAIAGRGGRDHAEVERAREHAERERQEQRKMGAVERVSRHRRSRRRRHHGKPTQSPDREPSPHTSARDTGADT